DYYCQSYDNSLSAVLF
nr:immunoglobulin light chain junction region [Macaca mulatta]MOY05119.1 immunoglobulin light chain junction region [Macaca mulatta]MOY05528.1 immunoglobulin light chain junction region [Macaca mulatta]MOY05706.1 immunoglobulin light chain junction region [Macaca mulatta]MOY06188.1 immunoglobulin light chain junction region [Macaca mulatta]